MNRSPAAAFWLSLLPGLGHLYLGQVAMGAAYALIAAGLIELPDRAADGFGILIPIFWGYVMIDAHRSAQELARNPDRARPAASRGTPWWGAVLIGLGVLFLLSNFGIDLFEHLWRFWPLALIGLGIKILRVGPREFIAGESAPSAPFEPPPLSPTDAAGSSEEAADER